MSTLGTLVALLAAAVVTVTLSRRLGFGSILGYLLAGILIGPGGLGLVADVEQITEISELGVIMLLFLIGLELRPQRLWVMRRSVFGLGSAQVAVTAAILAGTAIALGRAPASAIVLGLGFALSSTAIVLPLLGERDLLGTTAGRDGFAVLLFQDLAFIPLVAIVPLLGDSAILPDSVPWRQVGTGAAAIALILFGGRVLVRPLFRLVARERSTEVFTATALLVVIGTGGIAHAAGLSTSLGAFMAGVLLSDSEYRHELRADIEPFEGLLLGFFFMSVGMSADLGLAAEQPGVIAGGLLALLAIKSGVAMVLGRIGGQDWRNAIRFGLALPQGSEFSFVLFAAAIAVGALGKAEADAATLIVAASMVATPILFAGSERLVIPRLSRTAEASYDAINDDGVPVILCGFGRVGQIISRVLRMRGIPFTALDKDQAQVENVRRFGNKVYYGDPARADLMRAAGADTAKLVIVALETIEDSIRVVEMVRREFPHLRMLVRARNRQHVHLLMDRGVPESDAVRETFYSSLELSRLALDALGTPATETERTLKRFQKLDQKLLRKTHAVYRDERQLIQTTAQIIAEFDALIEAERAQAAEEAAAPEPQAAKA